MIEDPTFLCSAQQHECLLFFAQLSSMSARAHIESSSTVPLCMTEIYDYSSNSALHLLSVLSYSVWFIGVTSTESSGAAGAFVS